MADVNDPDALTAGMSGLIRAEAFARRVGRNATVNAPELRESASPLALALEAAQREMDAAGAVGDELRADHASRQIDALLNAAREAADEQTRRDAEALRFASGARPPADNRSANERMNADIREAVYGFRGA